MLDLIKELNFADSMSVAGFAGTLLSWFDARKHQETQTTIDNYLEWLRRTNHADLLDRLTDQQATLQSVTAIIDHLRSDEAERYTSLLESVHRRDSEVLNALGIIENDLRQLRDYIFVQGQSRFATQDAEQFERAYFALIREALSKVRLMGVPEMRHIEQALSIAYVSLSMRRESDSDFISEKAETVLRREPLLTIRGDAGSGKTTVLHWIAMQCIDTENPDNPWKGGVPFFVPLRRLKKAARGRISLSALHTYQFPHDDWPQEPPKHWHMQVLSDKRAVLLIDGVDELPPSQRPHFWTWLSDFMRTNSGNRVYITSRHFPERLGKYHVWNPPPSFAAANLLEMTNEDIAQFIGRWHDAIAHTPLPDLAYKELQSSRKELPVKLRDETNQRIRELCQTPLLCGLICALHWRDSEDLPSDRIELYQRCCKLLLTDRDLARQVETSEDAVSILAANDKEMLLQRLALDMMRNRRVRSAMHAIEATHEDAQKWIEGSLACVRHAYPHWLKPEEVLNHLLERTGLLTIPADGLVGFPHRSFQEYLAACAAGATNQIGDLVGRAEDDMWSETIVLSAGTKEGGVFFGHELIKALLDRAKKEPSARYHCIGLAAACLQTARQVDVALRESVVEALAAVLPPKTSHDVKGVSLAGTEVLAFLGSPPQDARACVAFIKTLGQIGTRKARQVLLRGYSDDTRVTVLKAVLSYPGIRPMEIAGLVKLFRDNKVPESLKTHFVELGPLYVSDGKLEDSEMGRQCLQNLKTERLTLHRYKKLRDIEAMPHLFPALRRVSIKECNQITDVSALAQLDRLEHLEVVSCSRLEKISAVPPSLLSVRVDECAELESLSFIRRCSSLRSVSARGCVKMQALGFVRSLEECEQINLAGCISLTDFAVLGRLKQCKRLSLARIPAVSDIEFLSGMTDLTHLDLTDCKGVDSLETLVAMPNLRAVWVRGTKIPGRGEQISREGMRKLEVIKAERSQIVWEKTF